MLVIKPVKVSVAETDRREKWVHVFYKTISVKWISVPSARIRSWFRVISRDNPPPPDIFNLDVYQLLARVNHIYLKIHLCTRVRRHLLRWHLFVGVKRRRSDERIITSLLAPLIFERRWSIRLRQLWYKAIFIEHQVRKCLLMAFKIKSLIMSQWQVYFSYLHNLVTQWESISLQQ